MTVTCLANKVCMPVQVEASEESANDRDFQL